MNRFIDNENGTITGSRAGCSEREAMTAFDEIKHRAKTLTARQGQCERDEQELLAITAALDDHPEQDGVSYDGPCACAICRSYGP